jgi:hypothetical protein
VEYRIFLEENGAFVPYLVLTAGYDGNVLLLREFLLDELMHFNPSPGINHDFWGLHDFGAYYDGSFIDTYLNTEFLATLGESVVNAMALSNIEITDLLNIHNNDIAREVPISIYRHVFLLSLRELGGFRRGVGVPEGEPLAYFATDRASRVAYLSNGRVRPYWTRTPAPSSTYRVFSIGEIATTSMPVDNRLGIRPAFALYPNTPITTSTDIIPGQTVFVLGSATP